MQKRKTFFLFKKLQTGRIHIFQQHYPINCINLITYIIITTYEFIVIYESMVYKNLRMNTLYTR